jgi:predicted ATPase
VLTRLRVSGFKNLVDTEIRFGPFTCIAGPNAVGKSNLFDAIRFLCFLANDTLLNAARSIRSEEGNSGDVRGLFHRAGSKYHEKMALEAEMIIPGEGIDDMSQRAEAAITFLRYKLEIGYQADDSLLSLGSLQLLTEELDHINLGDAHSLLSFPHSAKNWRREVVKGKRTTPFISTRGEPGSRVIKLSQDGDKGRPRSFSAEKLPRTVLSTVNATESPTALLARREMQSWRLLQLEPKALREPDSFTTPPGLGPDGSHLPATLFYLAEVKGKAENRDEKERLPMYDTVSSRLAELTHNVHTVQVGRDKQRELLTLLVTEQDGTVYPARSLSDGTLRFLALAVMGATPATSGVICIEEPENGMHPERIPALLGLLRDIACDPESPVGPNNGLRQVIVNTHSPAVLSQIGDDDLLVAAPSEVLADGVRFKTVHFRWLPDTWRSIAEPAIPTVDRGKLLAYLNPILRGDRVGEGLVRVERIKRHTTADHDDAQGVLLFSGDGE